ncbi:hypothetical protein [Streptomyces sp. NBC_00286]|uniref:hypothetical protein n=1 Tax=Streptomyces sp. NBC_00286 TaxID=2975701 RepID=UPI002E2B222B|nr:hypothetical protein [Streptomyces sp. NBC_00286]
MVSKRLKVKGKSGGTLMLDAQGLSLHVDGDEDGHAAALDLPREPTIGLITV